MSEKCGAWVGRESDGVEWSCGRPKGHPHDGTSVTRGNHARKPLPQDEPKK